MKCQHCPRLLSNRVGRGRGLCTRCYEDRAVRDLYPRRKSGPKDCDTPPVDDEPTEAELDALIAEQLKRLPVWWDEDCRAQREAEFEAKVYQLVRST